MTTFQRIFPLAFNYEQERQLWQGNVAKPGTQGMQAAQRLREQLKGKRK